MKSVLFLGNKKTDPVFLDEDMEKVFENDSMPIVTASTAKEVTNILNDETKEIAVIVSDQMTPTLKSNEFTSILKKQQTDIPIIILSEQSEQQELMDLIDMGTIGFISKPWNPLHLQTEIVKAQELYTLRTEHKKEEERKHKELKMAAEFQRTMLSIEIPSNDYFEFDIHYEPISKFDVTGDYFDIIQLDEDKFLVLSGDVSGHGLKTSFITAILKSIIYPVYIKDTLRDSVSPADLLNWLNVELCNFFKYSPDLFFTATAIVLDGSSGCMTIASGGQPPIVHISKNSPEIIATKDMVLGVNPMYKYNEEEIRLEKNDSLLLSSDGIYPIGNESQIFNLEDFKSSFLSMVQKEHSLAQLVEDIKNKIAPVDLNDDITMVGIRVK